MTSTNQNQPVQTITLPVRWADLDALGHVNSTRYLTYFEEARVKWLESLDLKVEQGLEGPVIVNSHANFLKPVFYPNNLIVKLFVSDPGRSSFLMSYEISTEASPNAICVDGYTKVVWVNYKQNKSTPIPDIIRTHCTNRMHDN